MFSISFKNGVSWVYISRTPFLIITAYFGIIVIAFSILMPDQTRRLPHDLETLADHISFICQSSLLEWEEFTPEMEKPPKEVRFPKRWWLSRSSATKVLNRSRGSDYEEGVEAKFAAQVSGDGAGEKLVAFGVFKGKGGSFHMGIDTPEKLEFLSREQQSRYLWKQFLNTII